MNTVFIIIWLANYYNYILLIQYPPSSSSSSSSFSSSSSPDHNKTHAADVLHATSYLLFEQIPEFSSETVPSFDREWKGYQKKLNSGGNIASAFSILEVFACYMASAMHDFDHPGRTNAFLVATKSPLVSIAVHL